MIRQKEINILKAVIDIKSDAELARRLNMTPANFQALTQKKTGLTQADLIRIADACGVVYVSAFVDKKGKTIAGGACNVSELDEIQTKPRGTHAHHKTAAAALRDGQPIRTEREPLPILAEYTNSQTDDRTEPTDNAGSTTTPND